MSFTDIPAELIVRMFHYVLPEDLEAFTLTCRHAYISSGSRLKEHQELKDKYATQSLNTSAHNVLAKMIQLCSDPIKIFYPKQLSFTGEGSWPHHPWYLMKPGIQYTNDVIPNLKPGLLDLLNIVTKNVSTMNRQQLMDWMNHRSGTSNDPLLALYLALCPNLKSISYTPLPLESTTLQHSNIMVRHIVKSYAGKRPSRALTKLSSATVYSKPWVSSPLNLFALFLILPSIKEIKGLTILSSAERIRLCPLKSSSVITITLLKSQISGEALSNLLQCVKGLKNFHYSHLEDNIFTLCSHLKQGRARSTESWEPHHLKSSLLAHAQHTLEELIIEYDCISCRGDIGLLACFTRLTTITLSACLLPLQDGELIDLDDFLPWTVTHLQINGIMSLPGNQELQVNALLLELEAWNGGAFRELSLRYRQLGSPSLLVEAPEMVVRNTFVVVPFDRPGLACVAGWEDFNDRLEWLECAVGSG